MIYVYALVTPIDFWIGWHKPEDIVSWSEGEAWSSGKIARWDYFPMLLMAQRIALEHLGWEGDIRKGEGPFISLIPSKDSCTGEIIIAWKQDNNGQTFVASPYALPWLVASDNDWYYEGEPK